MAFEVGCTLAMYLSAEHRAAAIVHRTNKQAYSISSPLAFTICSTRYLHVSERASESESEDWNTRLCGRWGRLCFLPYLPSFLTYLPRPRDNRDSAPSIPLPFVHRISSHHLSTWPRSRLNRYTLATNPSPEASPQPARLRCYSG